MTLNASSRRCRYAGIKRIDHLLITHYHTDHVGGVPDLVARVEVGEFLDHGPNREDTPGTEAGYEAYLKAIAGHSRRIVHPGDTIPMEGLNIVVLTADGEHISAVPGIKPEPNPYCTKERPGIQIPRKMRVPRESSSPMASSNFSISAT